ncbi:hypothetical protein BC830DRAFT_740912 [Chytriomyces sp. MP71]|nr:hypothetical protein BC830DRAFT_740912 [Chytriomyces sp. MP71]
MLRERLPCTPVVSAMKGQILCFRRASKGFEGASREISECRDIEKAGKGAHGPSFYFFERCVTERACACLDVFDYVVSEWRRGSSAVGGKAARRGVQRGESGDGLRLCLASHAFDAPPSSTEDAQCPLALGLDPTTASGSLASCPLSQKTSRACVSCPLCPSADGPRTRRARRRRTEVTVRTAQAQFPQATPRQAPSLATRSRISLSRPSFSPPVPSSPFLSTASSNKPLQTPSRLADQQTRKTTVNSNNTNLSSTTLHSTKCLSLVSISET